MARILWELLIMKPCPFCGEEPRITPADEKRGFRAFATCRGCGVSRPENTWENRTPGPATRAMLEMAERNRRPPVEGSGLAVLLVRIAELEAFLAEWKDD